MKIFGYITGFLLLVIGFQFVAHKCDRRKLTREVTAYQAALDSCMHAEPKRDTLWLFKTVKDTIRLTYRYNVIQTDTIAGTIETREYTGNYNSDLMAVRWRAVVFGELQSMEILPTSSYRYPQITLTRVVPVPCPKVGEVISRERSHLYMFANLYQGPYFQTGLEYIRKEGWGVSAGMMSDGEKIYFGGGIKIRLR
jgi:hypothetical protein